MNASLDLDLNLSAELSVTLGMTQALGSLPDRSPRTRVDVGISYNLAESLRRAGWF